MVTASLISPHEPSADDEQRVLLHDVPWSTYVVLADSIDSRAVRLTYLDGWLEIMTTSTLHEVSKTQIARFLETFCLERDIPIYGYGIATLREEAKKRGLEPDEWYRVREDGWPPHLALEVVVSNPLLNKLEVYRGFQIPEVWVYLAKTSTFKLFALRGEQYEQVDKSEVLPEVDLARLLHYLAQPDHHVAIKAFRDELRGTP